MSAETEADGSVTAILKRADPLWWWLRENFKLPSLAAIAALVAGGSGWIWREHVAISALQARPDLGPQLAGLAARLDVDERQELAAGYERRLGDLEGYWRDAGRVAAELKPRRRALPHPRPVNQFRTEVPP